MFVLMVEAMGGNVTVVEVEMIDAVSAGEVFDIDSGSDVLVIVETVENSDVVTATVADIVSSALALAGSDDDV